MKTKEFPVDDKTVSVYPAQNVEAPMVCCCEFSDSGEAILAACRDFACPPFHLVTVRVPNWDRDLSPWPLNTAPFQAGAGKAPLTMRLLDETIIPRAEAALQTENPLRILCGYSMAGLFAASAPFLSERFHALVCASAILWYPGFPEYFTSHFFLKRPVAAYFSLGDAESPVHGEYFEAVTRKIREECEKRGVLTLYESTHGDHFDDPCRRLAKGIRWTLDRFTDENTDNP